MTIKLNTTNDFITFYEKHTKNATIFCFDNSKSNEAFMICDCKYSIIYECKNHDERNNIINYFNANQINYVVVYEQTLPKYDYNFTTITI